MRHPALFAVGLLLILALGALNACGIVRVG